MTNCDCHIEPDSKDQRKILITLLAINSTMFVVEIVTGIVAESTGLIADAMDMLADAMVYGIALYAVGHSLAAKTRAAFISGLMQIILGLSVAIDVSRRFIIGSEPESLFMVGIGCIALAANIICLTMIAKHRGGEIHMRASWIFSKNDVIANLGVILSGALVMMLDNRLPDLVIGGLISLLVIRGGGQIITQTRTTSSPHK